MALTVNADLTTDEQLEPDGIFKEGDPMPHERVELFRADGLVYTVAREIDPAIVFRYMRNLRRNSEEFAVATLLEEVLGTQTVDMLADNQTLTPAEFKAVMKAVQKYTMGATKDLLGK